MIHTYRGLAIAAGLHNAPLFTLFNSTETRRNTWRAFCAYNAGLRALPQRGPGAQSGILGRKAKPHGRVKSLLTSTSTISDLRNIYVRPKANIANLICRTEPQQRLMKKTKNKNRDAQDKRSSHEAVESVLRPEGSLWWERLVLGRSKREAKVAHLLLANCSLVSLLKMRLTRPNSSKARAAVSQWFRRLCFRVLSTAVCSCIRT